MKQLQDSPMARIIFSGGLSMIGSNGSGAVRTPKLTFIVGLFALTISLAINSYAASAGLVAAAATANSINLTWTAPGDDSATGTASQYDVRYSTSVITAANWGSATQATGEPTPHAAGTLETFTVTGLNPSTTYYFAVKSADEVPNWSAISNVVAKATTAETTPPAAIVNLAVGSVTSSSIQLTWTAPGDDSVTGTATTYDVRYSTSAITAANFSSATQATGEPSPGVAGSAQSFTVSGLSPNTTYYFAIKTADEVPNWSGISNVISQATSQESTPPAAIANLASSTTTSTSVMLVWTAPGDDGTNGTASQYDIRYSTSTITEANWGSAAQVTGEPAPKAAGSAETFTVTGLQNGTTYYFAIKTADEVPNWSALSNVVQRATLDQIAPAAIMDLSAEPGASSGEIDLTWTAPGDDGNFGTASSYVLRYSTVPITELNWHSATPFGAPNPAPAGTIQTATLDELDVGQTYYFAIIARDEVLNESGLSNIASSAPQTDFVLDFGDEQVSIAFPPAGSKLRSSHPILSVNNIGGSENVYHFEVAADSFFINVVAVSPPVTQEEGPSTSWRVSEKLDGDRIYYWRARANEFAYSDISYFSLNPVSHAYPNPFRPERDGAATFVDIPEGSNLVLLTLSGSPVREFSNVTSNELQWDGRDESGGQVGSGTYLWYVSGSDAKGKLVVIR
jgi:phosphodiesterase/alkaline phosphatase D-like protein